MTIHYLIGDATAPQAPGNNIICHICNDIGGWGKGFVVAISRRWPEPEQAYRAWHQQGFSLGEIQLVQVQPQLWVANMVAQHKLKPQNGVAPIRYQALAECLDKLSRRALELEASVHMPRIGCGLAGGSWDEIEEIIRKTLLAAGVAVYVYDRAS